MSRRRCRRVISHAFGGGPDARPARRRWKRIRLRTRSRKSSSSGSRAASRWPSRGSRSHTRWSPEGSSTTIWTPSVLRTLARAGARSSSVSSCASEKPSGASTRTTVGGISSGRQIVGLSFAGKSGSRAKGYPPATGKLRHGGLFGDLARGDSLQGLPEVLAVVRIAPQELPGKARAIEPQQRVDRMLRPPVRRPWHASPPRSKALLRANQ